MTLWAVFGKAISKIIQPSIIDKIKRQVCTKDIRLESGRSNPVQNDLLVVTGRKGNVLIDEISEEHNLLVRGGLKLSNILHS